jgi:hypothetical protein
MSQDNAMAIFSNVLIFGFLLPGSRCPVCERSTPAISARSSCEIPLATQRCRCSFLRSSADKRRTPAFATFLLPEYATGPSMARKGKRTSFPIRACTVAYISNERTQGGRTPPIGGFPWVRFCLDRHWRRPAKCFLRRDRRLPFGTQTNLQSVTLMPLLASVT